MRRGYSVGEASRYLNIDPKTLHKWCKELAITPAMSAANGRVKIYSQKQLDSIATLLRSEVKGGLSVISTTSDDYEEKHNTQLQELQARVAAMEHELRVTCERIALACVPNRANNP